MHGLGHFQQNQTGCRTLGKSAGEDEITGQKIDQSKLFSLNLDEFCNFLKPVCTRWNSTLEMLNSIREQKKAILWILAEANEPPRKQRRIGNEARAAQNDFPKLDSLDFEVLKSICAALKPFENATKMFSKETTSASCILPTLSQLKEHLRQQSDRGNNFAAVLVEHLLREITARYERLRDYNFLWFSTLMDPRFAYCKTLAFDNQWRDFEEQFVQFCIESNFKQISLIF